MSYNLPGVKSGLKLDGPTLADIFSGKIKTWNDPAIKALNPGLSLPSTAITVVHRSDSSGTTNGFTTYLSDVSPTWASSIGSGKDVKWPVGTGAAKNSGVAAAVKQTTGAVGYVEQAYALENGFTYASVKNSAGTYVLPTISNTSAAADGVKVPAGPRDLDDQLAEPAGVPDRLADVPGRLPGPVQVGRRQLVGRERSEEVLHLRVRRWPADARVGLEPAPVRAAPVLAGCQGQRAAGEDDLQRIADLIRAGRGAPDHGCKQRHGKRRPLDTRAVAAEPSARSGPADGG